MVKRKKGDVVDEDPKYAVHFCFVSDRCLHSQIESLRMRVDDFNSTHWVLEEIDGRPVIDRVQSAMRFRLR